LRIIFDFAIGTIVAGKILGRQRLPGCTGISDGFQEGRSCGRADGGELRLDGRGHMDVAAGQANEWFGSCEMGKWGENVEEFPGILRVDGIEGSQDGWDDEIWVLDLVELVHDLTALSLA